jgi:DnaJ-class molecular chaperone
MNLKDYYATLGVREGATEEEIRKAFRNLAKRHHPDANPENRSAAEARFKEISEAHDILSNPEKRKHYDAMRRYGAGGGPGGSGFSWEDFARAAGAAGGRSRAGRAAGAGGAAFEFSDLEDFLSRVFGDVNPFTGAGSGSWSFSAGPGGFRASRRFGDGGAPGGGPSGAGGFAAAHDVDESRDRHATITIPFELAVHGGPTTIELDRQTAVPGKRGRAATKRVRLSVKIPRGIEDGTRIRLSGQGAEGGNGRSGDLFLEVRVSPHPRFERRGRDILTEEPVTFADLALGGKVRIVTVHGKQVDLTIPEGTQTGRTFRLRGLGIEDARGRGDHLVRVRAVTPEHLDSEAKELLRRLAPKLRRSA